MKTPDKILKFEDRFRQKTPQFVVEIPLAICPDCGENLDETVPFPWCDACEKRADLPPQTAASKPRFSSTETE
jgi:hypothetical protein